MFLENLIAHYGVLAVFVGSAIEGETIAFLGGVIAHRDLMPLWQAMLAASLGSFTSDQMLFFAGRYAGGLRVVRHFSASPAMSGVLKRLEAYPTAFILGFRFLYGIRTISPIAIGLSRVSVRQFVVLNVIAAVIWGVLITTIGYVFGSAVEALVGRLELHLHLILAIVFAIVVAVAVTAYVRNTMRKD